MRVAHTLSVLTQAQEKDIHCSDEYLQEGSRWRSSWESQFVSDTAITMALSSSSLQEISLSCYGLRISHWGEDKVMDPLSLSAVLRENSGHPRTGHFDRGLSLREPNPTAITAGNNKKRQSVPKWFSEDMLSRLFVMPSHGRRRQNFNMSWERSMRPFLSAPSTNTLVCKDGEPRSFKGSTELSDKTTTKLKDTAGWNVRSYQGLSLLNRFK